jgi:hypothetical protein
MDIQVNQIIRHRNGVDGEPFYAVYFYNNEPDEPTYSGYLVGIVTDKKRSCYVINPGRPELKYRGDNFEDDLRKAIIKNEADTYQGGSIEKAKKVLNDGLQVPVY